MGRFAAAGIGAVLACALVASGCGGDGRLTRAELVGRADAICHREDVARTRAIQLTTAEARAEHLVGEQLFARLYARYGALYLTAARRLADLRPPAELAGSYRRYVATRRRLIGLQPIAKPGDDPRAYTRDRLENANVALARRLGFRVCH